MKNPFPLPIKVEVTAAMKGLKIVAVLSLLAELAAAAAYFVRPAR